METTIKLIYENECSDLAVYKTPARKVEVTLEATEMTLPELLEQMDLFVKACGYVPPENCILDYIDNDDFVAHDESKAWPGEKEWQETDRSMMEPSI
jgi:hypothetical protein